VDDAILCANYPNPTCQSAPPTNPLSLNQAFINKVDYPGVFNTPANWTQKFTVVPLFATSIVNGDQSLYVQRVAAYNGVGLSGANQPSLRVYNNIGSGGANSPNGVELGALILVDTYTATAGVGNAVAASAVNFVHSDVPSWGMTIELDDRYSHVINPAYGKVALEVDVEGFGTDTGVARNGIAINVRDPATLWNSATSYTVGQTVYLTVGGQVYQAVAPSTNQTPPNATYWNPISGLHVSKGLRLTSSFYPMSIGGFDTGIAFETNFYTAGIDFSQATMVGVATPAVRLASNMFIGFDGNANSHLLSYQSGITCLRYQNPSVTVFLACDDNSFRLPNAPATSSGGTAGYACIDGNGIIYKKATPTSCP
jgi:hypothetical protein